MMMQLHAWHWPRVDTCKSCIGLSLMSLTSKLAIFSYFTTSEYIASCAVVIVIANVIDKSVDLIGLSRNPGASTTRCTLSPQTRSLGTLEGLFFVL